MTAENFAKKHFKGIEKETWYPAIVAIAEGYAQQEIDKAIDVALKVASEKAEIRIDWDDSNLPLSIKVKPDSILSLKPLILEQLKKETK